MYLTYFLAFSSINSWWLDICLYENPDMLQRESKKLLLNDSDQSIIARAAPPFIAHLVALCHIGPSLMCWHDDMKVRWSCVSEQFCDIHIKFLIPNNCWVIFLYCNKSNYLSIWEYFRFGQICLSLSATTFHFPLWKDLVLTSFYPSFKTFLRLPSSI